METLRYDYKPKAWVLVLAGLVLAVFCFLGGRMALENDRGLILNGVIRLDIGEATFFYWAIAAFFALAVALALFGIVRALGAPQEVVLDEISITAPKGMFGHVPVNVPYAQITDLSIMEFNLQKMLTIHHLGGKLIVQRSMLPTRENFEEIVEALGARCRAAQGF